MNSFTNRFSVLQMDSDSDSLQGPDRPPSPHTPPYPPTYGNTPRAPVKGPKDTVEDNRFRTWTDDNITKNSAALFGRQNQVYKYQAGRRTATTLLNTSSNVQFPSLIGPPPNTPVTSANTWRESFAKKVIDMAERDRVRVQEDLMREKEKQCAPVEMYPITNRFRRTLEDILAEEDDYARGDDIYDDCGSQQSNEDANAMTDE